MVLAILGIRGGPPPVGRAGLGSSNFVPLGGWDFDCWSIAYTNAASSSETNAERLCTHAAASGETFFQFVIWKGHQVDVGMALISSTNHLQDQGRALLTRCTSRGKSCRLLEVLAT
eukprot:8867023-Pyramimonas_sp.AAC.1